MNIQSFRIDKKSLILFGRLILDEIFSFVTLSTVESYNSDELNRLRSYMPGHAEPSTFQEITLEDKTIKIHYLDKGIGQPYLYLHGWGCHYGVFDPLMENLKDLGQQIAIDFPGFGQSPLPPSAWDTEKYAECIKIFLDRQNISTCIVITHSFGGRVALRLAKRWPETFSAMILIAAAGLKRKVPWQRRLRIKTIRNSARLVEKMIPGSLGRKLKETLYSKIASRDYQNAGELRPILVKVVNEDLTHLLPQIQNPVLLLYGGDDTETPPAMGKRIADLLPNSTYVEIPGFDHLSILDRGRHQVEHRIRQFLKGLGHAE